MNQEKNTSAYVQDDECGICKQKRGNLHLWYCIFRDPYLYIESDGSLVELKPRPKPTLRVVWEGYDEGPPGHRRAKLYENGSVEPAWNNPVSYCKAMEQLGAVLAEVLRPAKLHVIECVRQGKHLEEMEGENCKYCGRNINFLLDNPNQGGGA